MKLNTLHPIFMSNIQAYSTCTSPQYWVTECGQVFNVDYLGTGKVREMNYTLIDTDCPHVQVRLKGVNGKYHLHYIHHLVAGIYLENPPGYGYVLIHKDGNGLNNSKHNLLWLKREDNGVRNILKKYSNKNHNVLPVAKYTANGERLETYPSCKEAAEILNLPSGAVKSAADYSNSGGSLGQAGDYFWKYIQPLQYSFK